jgi:ribosomal protein S12 methylthiotransferase
MQAQDVVLVNTCGFLDSAKEESLAAAIGEAIAENGRVIVTGCMGNEADAIRAKFPSVLAVTGAHRVRSCRRGRSRSCADLDQPLRGPHPQADPGDVKLTPRHYSYLKISEGCNHACAFCIIPSLRGKLASRRIDAVLREAEKLVAAGTRELLVISQDTSAYGVDVRHGTRQWKGREVRSPHDRPRPRTGPVAHAERAHTVGAPALRLPYPHVDAVIPLMAEGLLTPYLDIPFQHASPNVLRAMSAPPTRPRCSNA